MGKPVFPPQHTRFLPIHTHTYTTANQTPNTLSPLQTQTQNTPQVVTRVWDCFLAEGWKVLYRVQLAILSLHEKVG